jgi:hypothetical protein
MKILLLLLLTISCARKESHKEAVQCRSSESMTLECQIVNTPIYGSNYARRICTEQYRTNRCW